jgi:acetyl-CoA acetyltransferase
MSQLTVNGIRVDDTFAEAFPITGARLLVTLLYAMKDLGKKRGVASLCIGGGEGIALMVERP